MNRSTWSIEWALIFGLFAAGCVPNFEDLGCLGDDECSSGQVCVAGTCSAPARADAGLTSDSGSPADANLANDADADLATDATDATDANDANDANDGAIAADGGDAAAPIDAAPPDSAIPPDAGIAAGGGDAAVPDSGLPTEDCTSVRFTGDSNPFVSTFDPALDTPTFTVEAWILANQADQTSGIVSRQEPPAACVFKLGLDDGKPQFCIYQDCQTYTCATSATELPTDVWTHLAGVWDGSNVTIYVGGAGTSIAGAVLPAVNQEPLRLGQGFDSNGRQKFSGSLASVRVSSGAQYSGPFNPALFPRTAETIALYPLNEGSGTNIFDVSGNQLNGETTTDMVWATFDGPTCAPFYHSPLPADADCVVRLPFDANPVVDACGGLANVSVTGWNAVAARVPSLGLGFSTHQDQRIDLGEPFPLPADDFTVEMTVRDDNSGGVLFSDRPFSGPGMGMSLTYLGQLYVEISDSLGNTEFVTGRTPAMPATMAWHHLALQYFQATRRVQLFVDGVLAFDQVLLISRYEGGTYNLHLGAGINPGDMGVVMPFRGSLDELRISRGIRY